MNTLKEKLMASHDPQLMSGVQKFLTRFEKLADHHFLAKFSPIWMGNGNHNKNTRWPNKTWQENSHPGTGLSRGKGKITAGRPVNKHRKPVRRKATGKSQQSINTNIYTGKQNAGKW